MAKETRVGGTSRSRKEPDMESLPPMAATPRSDLRLVCAQQGGEGLAPTRRVRLGAVQNTPGRRGRPLEASQPAATSLAHGLDDRSQRAPVIGVCVPCGRGRSPQAMTEQVSVLLARADRESSATIACAGVSCVLAAEGHQHGARADGGVEPLGQAALGGQVGVAGRRHSGLPRRRCPPASAVPGSCAARRRRCACPRRWSSGRRGTGRR